MISDATVRAVMGVIMAENRKLKAENTLLKSQANVVVDRRRAVEQPASAQQVMQVLPPLSTLISVEIEALRQAISEEFLQQMGWAKDSKTGRVTKNGHPIFWSGFGTAIQKVLDCCSEET